MINISIGDCHPFDINKSILFHRILGGGKTLAATDGLDNFEYLIVNSTTNEVKHYTPLLLLVNSRRIMALWWILRV